MKKVPYLLLLSFVMAVMNVKADIVPLNNTNVAVRITNSSDFSDMAFIYYFDRASTYSGTSGITISNSQGESLSASEMADYFFMLITKNQNANKAGLITSDILPRAAKNYPLYIYAVKKDYLKTVDLQKNDWLNDKHAQRINLVVNAASFISEVYSRVEVQYTLARKKNTFYVYKSKVASVYRGGNADFVEVFKDDVVDVTKPIEVSVETLPHFAYRK